MPHDDPAVGRIIEADWGIQLDTQGLFTPQLLASTTNPNLGDDGVAFGWWHRNGHMIHCEARFDFAGANVSAGSGNYGITFPPFPPDDSLLRSSGAASGGSPLGQGNTRDSSSAGNGRGLIVVYAGTIGTEKVVFLNITGVAGFVDDATPNIWAAGDRIHATWTYPAEPSGLP